MRMDVDKAWRDQKTARVDLLAPASRNRSDLRNPARGYGDISHDGRSAGPVDHGPPAHHQVESALQGVLLRQTADDTSARLPATKHANTAGCTGFTENGKDPWP